MLEVGATSLAASLVKSVIVTQTDTGSPFEFKDETYLNGAGLAKEGTQKYFAAKKTTGEERIRLENEALEKFERAIAFLEAVQTKNYDALIQIFPRTKENQRVEEDLKQQAINTQEASKELVAKLQEKIKELRKPRVENLEELRELKIKAGIIGSFFGADRLETRKELVSEALKVLGTKSDKENETVLQLAKIVSAVIKKRESEDYFPDPNDIKILKEYGIYNLDELFQSQTISQWYRKISEHSHLTVQGGEDPSRSLVHARAGLEEEGVLEKPTLPRMANECKMFLRTTGVKEDKPLITRREPINIERIEAQFHDKHDHALYLIKALIQDELIVSTAQAEALSIIARVDKESLSAIKKGLKEGKLDYDGLQSDVKEAFLGRALPSRKPAFVPTILLSSYLDFYYAKVGEGVNKSYKRWEESHKHEILERGKVKQIRGEVNDPFHGQSIGECDEQVDNIVELIGACAVQDVITDSGVVKLLTPEESRILTSMISDYQTFSADYRTLENKQNKEKLARILVRIAREKIEPYNLDVLNLIRRQVLREGNQALTIPPNHRLQLPPSVLNLRKFMGFKVEVLNLEQYLYSKHPELLAGVIVPLSSAGEAGEQRLSELSPEPPALIQTGENLVTETETGPVEPAALTPVGEEESGLLISDTLRSAAGGESGSVETSIVEAGSELPVTLAEPPTLLPVLEPASNGAARAAETTELKVPPGIDPLLLEILKALK